MLPTFFEFPSEYNGHLFEACNAYFMDKKVMLNIVPDLLGCSVLVVLKMWAFIVKEPQH